MKKLLILLLAAAFALPAAAQGIDLRRDNVSVQDAIALLSKASNYSVTVNSDNVDLSRKVNVRASGATIEEVLSQIFAGQDVDFRIEGNSIYVTRRSAGPRAQAPRALKGRVIDENGDPLPGASIMIEGTRNGFICDV
ncbi:MAG: secretin and TonB N-terminal domain-containing protein, partial [Bacteroidales bacterium]|nr:secretin and TonB N-terminal domain-containing protein [Bacteroidales bacterium]